VYYVINQLNPVHTLTPNLSQINFNIVTNSQVLFHDGTFITLSVQYTTLDYSSQLFSNSNTSTTSTGSRTQLTNYTAGKYTSYLFAFQHSTVDYSSSITHVHTLLVFSHNY
jgi:hypothetical protein